MPGQEPVDTPFDFDSWGVCTERAFLDGLATELKNAAKTCGATLAN